MDECMLIAEIRLMHKVLLTFSVDLLIGFR